MKHVVIGVLYALLMIAVIVGVDIAWLQDQPMIRLFVNIGIVLAFGAFYLLVLRPRS